MATLKEKSATNLGSALVLTSKAETCLSSIHCAYYSCYQLMLYYLDTVFAYDDTKRRTEYENYLKSFTGVGKRFGSHEYWISQFTEFVKRKGHAINSSLIDMNLKLLKEARTEADYQEKDLSKQYTDSLYDKALETIKLINKSFCF